MTTTHEITTDLDTGYPADAAATILAATTGDTIRHIYTADPTVYTSWPGDYHHDLIVNHRAWEPHPDWTDAEFVEAIDNGLPPIEVTLTEDGRPANRTEWHPGSPLGSWIAYEAWSARGREAHGYVDSVTRKLVQVG